MFGIDNCQKMMTVMEHLHLSNPSPGPLALLALDAEKAFDNVNWVWLNKVMAHMSCVFLNLISAFHFSPKAQISLSSPFLTIPITERDLPSVASTV